MEHATEWGYLLSATPWHAYASALPRADTINVPPTWRAQIIGTLDYGQILYAPGTPADANGIVAPITYQWMADGVAIAGATDTLHLLSHADVGKAITVTASFVDGLGKPEQISTNPSALVNVSVKAEALYAAGVAVTMLNRAFNDISPPVNVFMNQRDIASRSDDGIAKLALEFGHTYDSMSSDLLASIVITNTGLDAFSADLVPALSAYFNANFTSRGFVVLQFAQLLVTLATDHPPGLERYAAAGDAWIRELYAGYVRSSDPTNMTTSPPGTTLGSSVVANGPVPSLQASDLEFITLVGVPAFSG